jgi:type VI secretion system secreted protein Hcp
MPIYVKYASIDGDVTESTHGKWIEAMFVQWRGIDRGITSPTGSSADRESSAPTVREAVVSKPFDSASVQLLNEALQGEGEDVTIDFCKTDKGQLSVYMSFTLNNTLISGYEAGSAGTDRPIESWTFNFTKFAIRDIGLGAKNEDGSPATVTYDLATAKVQ